MKTAAAVDLLLALLTRAHEISQLIAAARAEGRDDLTEAEMAVLVAQNDLARAKLEDAIKAAEDAGR